MCVIAVCLKNKPSSDIVKKMWDTNDDGASITWLGKDRKVEYIKGITKLEELNNLIKATELPFVLHFRIASVGGIHPLLTHPEFEISKKSQLLTYNQCNRVLLMNEIQKLISAANVFMRLDLNCLWKRIIPRSSR